MRPSYVLGGRAMEIVYDDDDLRRAMAELAGFGSLGIEGGLSAERPVLVDRFLEDATEVDCDAVRDRTGDFLHRRDHGARRGGRRALGRQRLRAARRTRCRPRPWRSSRSTPAASPRPSTSTGLINVQYAVKRGQVFVIEANPRASRTVPFVAKATGVPLAKVAARVMLGATLDELRAEGLLRPPVGGDHVAVKEAVLPFGRFPEADSLLGPEMRSTGEVMGIDRTVGLAFAKSQLAAGTRLPRGGHGVPVAGRPRQGAGRRGRPPVRRAGLRHRRHDGHGRSRWSAAGIAGGHGGGQAGRAAAPTPSS